MLRLFDLVLSMVGVVLGFPAFLAIVVCGYFDTGSPLFVQQRVGRYRQPFMLVKFRTMRPGTVSVATHLADASSITSFGQFLRRTKLDEFPQLWNVLRGEMSLVGPRPGLFNQDELLNERDQLGVFAVRPGITGLAQITGVDMSTPALLAKTDKRMIESLSVSAYFKYILLTIFGRGRGDAIMRRKD